MSTPTSPWRYAIEQSAEDLTPEALGMIQGNIELSKDIVLLTLSYIGFIPKESRSVRENTLRHSAYRLVSEITRQEIREAAEGLHPVDLLDYYLELACIVEAVEMANGDAADAVDDAKFELQGIAHTCDECADIARLYVQEIGNRGHLAYQLASKALAL